MANERTVLKMAKLTVPILADWESIESYMALNDIVHVVRCRECKYSDTFTPDCTEATFPLKCLSIRYGGVYPDWFCEHGQRREDGDA